MNLRIWINNVEYTDTTPFYKNQSITYPIHFTDTIDGGQDEAGFILYTFGSIDDAPFPQYSEVKIQINDNIYYWYLASDQVTRETKSAPNKHTITLIERVRILEGYYLSDISFTQPLQRNLALAEEIYTYKSAIDRVLAITPLRFAYTYPKFSLDDALTDKLSRIEFPESFPTSKNLYEFMLNVGRMIKAVPYMTDWNVISFWFIDDLTKTSEAIGWYPGRNLNYMSELTIDQYCTNIDVTLENLTVENNDKQGAIICPSKSGFMYYRDNNDIQFMANQESLILELPYPIFKVTKLICLYSAIVMTIGSTSELLESYPIDLASRVLEKTKYDALPELERVKYCYYEYGKNCIGGLLFAYEKVFGESPAAVNVMAPLAYADTHSDGSSISVANPLFLNNPDTQTNPKNYLYRVEFVPILEKLRCKIERKSGDDFRTEYSFIANQSEKVVSSKQSGDFYQQHIERIGKRIIKYVHIVENSETQIPPIGSYVTKSSAKYFLYRLNWQIVSPDKAIVESFWSKDFTAISEKIGLNAMPRFSEITLDFVKRADVLREFCAISHTSRLSSSHFYTSYNLNKKAMRAFIGAGQEYTASEDMSDFCSFAYVRTYYKSGASIQGEDKALLMPVSSMALGNSINLFIDFKDNYSAGTQIKKIDPSKAQEGYYDVRYTGINSLGGSFGRLDGIQIDFITNTEYGSTLTSVADAKLLPEITVGDFSRNRLFTLGVIPYDKDNKEVPAITYQLCAEAEDTLVLGSAFTQRNLLIARNPPEYVIMTALTRVSYNTTTHTYYADSTGLYIKHKDKVIVYTTARRYNKVTDESYTQSNTGLYYKFDLALRLVYCDKLIDSDTDVPFAALSYINVGLTDPISGLPVVWFGNDYGTPATFDTQYKAWAIIDENDDLWIGNNAKDFNNVYFNFTKEKTYANQV